MKTKHILLAVLALPSIALASENTQQTTGAGSSGTGRDIATEGAPATGGNATTNTETVRENHAEHNRPTGGTGAGSGEGGAATKPTGQPSTGGSY